MDIFQLDKTRVNEINHKAGLINEKIGVNIDESEYSNIKFAIKCELGEDFQIIEDDLPEEDVLGAYNQKTNKIFIDTKIDTTEKVFTLLHEFGHAHLEHSSDKTHRRRLVDMLYETDEEEIEANLFAALVIVRKERLRLCLNKFFGKNKEFDRELLIKNISDFFGISDVVAEFRLLKFMHYSV